MPEYTDKRLGIDLNFYEYFLLHFILCQSEEKKKKGYIMLGRINATPQLGILSELLYYDTERSQGRTSTGHFFILTT